MSSSTWYATGTGGDHALSDSPSSICRHTSLASSARVDCAAERPVTRLRECQSPMSTENTDRTRIDSSSCTIRCRQNCACEIAESR